MIVYIVTGGEYSDYSIYCIFSNKQLAKEWISKQSNDIYGKNDYNIEEWSMDEQINVVEMTVYQQGIFLDTGELIESYQNIVVRNPFRGECLQSAVKVPMYNNRQVSRVISGVSREHAEKLAIEARQRFLRNESIGKSFDTN